MATRLFPNDFVISCCEVLEGETGRVSPTRRMSLLTGTFPYRAPELLRGDAPDTKADIYSLGVTLWQMESRQTPYAGHEPHAIVFNVVAYNARPTVRALDLALVLGFVSLRSLGDVTASPVGHRLDFAAHFYTVVDVMSVR